MSSKVKKNKSLTLIKPVGEVLKSKKFHTINSEVDSLIEELGEIQNYDPSLLFTIMTYVENVSSVKLTGEEKKKIVIDKVLSLCVEKNNCKDIEELNKYIDFFCHMKWINKIATSKIVKNEVKNLCSIFFQKK